MTDTNEEIKIEPTPEESLIENVLGLDEDISEDSEKETEAPQEKDNSLPPERAAHQSDELNQLDRKINKRVDARVDRLEKQLEKKIEAERDAYIGAIATVQERLDAAIDNNNIKEVKQAEKALETLQAKKDELETDLKVIKEDVPDETTKEKPKEVKIDEAASRWLQANKALVDKINNDPGLSAIASGISAKLLKNGYAGKPQIELLAEVKKRILEENPEDFAGIVNKRDELPNVSGGKMDTTASTGGVKKTYTMKDVPPIDRQILKNYITAKVYKDEADAVTKYFQRKSKENR